jgi:hypothetical protein
VRDARPEVRRHHDGVIGGQVGDVSDGQDRHPTWCPRTGRARFVSGDGLDQLVVLAGQAAGQLRSRGSQRASRRRDLPPTASRHVARGVAWGMAKTAGRRLFCPTPWGQNLALDSFEILVVSGDSDTLSRWSRLRASNRGILMGLRLRRTYVRPTMSRSTMPTKNAPQS